MAEKSQNADSGKEIKKIKKEIRKTLSADLNKFDVRTSDGRNTQWQTYGILLEQHE